MPTNYTGPDMSGYQGEEGMRRWMQESGGSQQDYQREMSRWEHRDDPQGDSFRGTYTPGQGSGYGSGYGAKTMKASDLGPNPTPSQIRQFSWDQGWGTDDYGDIDDATIQGWIDNGYWDAASGRFKNDYGDLVDKPWDDGPISNGRQAEFNTGRYGNPEEVRIGGGGGGAAASNKGGESKYYGQDDPLQRYLTGMFSDQGGVFGQTGRPQEGAALQGGGIWWAPASSEYSLGGVERNQPAQPRYGSGNQGAVGIEAALPTNPNRVVGGNEGFISAEQANPFLPPTGATPAMPGYKRDSIDTMLNRTNQDRGFSWF